MSKDEHKGPRKPNPHYKGPHYLCSSCGVCTCNHMGRGECP